MRENKVNEIRNLLDERTKKISLFNYYSNIQEAKKMLAPEDDTELKRGTTQRSITLYDLHKVSNL